MTKQISNAAAERAAAQGALRKGELRERDSYTAKQVAMRCGTDAKTMRKFFRSNHSTTEAVGQGGRYEFDAKDLPKIKEEFAAWLTRSSVKRPKIAPEIAPERGESKSLVSAVDKALEELTDGEDHFGEPTEEELAEIDDLNLEEEGDD